MGEKKLSDYDKAEINAEKINTDKLKLCIKNIEEVMNKSGLSYYNLIHSLKFCIDKLNFENITNNLKASFSNKELKEELKKLDNNI
jgi:plasmid rolling circle replication initiator protein Rep